MTAKAWRRLAPYLLWLVSAASALLLRPPLPIDETRYLTVAWEMWRDGSFLVPHLNGVVYSHKPPLLFWLIDLAWWIGGVSEPLARAIPMAFSLLCIWLAGTLSRRLWPQYPAAAEWTRIALAGLPAFLLFGSLVMFDSLLTVATLLGLLGLLQAAVGRDWWRGWLLYGLALGLGLLAKGPVIALHLLPAGLLAPLWTCRPGGGWRVWYGGLALAVLIGLWIGLAWAIPAARAGGGSFGLEIFWSQTAGRIAESFAHRQPWYFFILLLPLMLFPWSWFPGLWRGLLGLAGSPEGYGLRLPLIWGLSALALFSAISGKQAHYLLPELPAFALVMGFAIARVGLASRAVPAVLILPVLALVIFVAVPPLTSLPAIVDLAEPILLDHRTVLLLLIPAFLLLGQRRLAAPPLRLATLAVLLLVTVHAAAAPLLAAAYDLHPIAEVIARYQDEGIASTCGYHGEYGFLARLRRPVTELPAAAAAVWLAAHPRGLLVTCPKESPTEDLKPLRLQHYRSRWLALYGGRRLMEEAGSP